MGRPTSSIRLTEFQTHVAVGTLLGDASLSKPDSGKNYHLSCYHAEKQREWLLCKHTWLLPAARPIQWTAYVDKRDGKAHPGGRFHTVSIPCFTALESLLYEDRIKRITPDYLRLFTHPIALACLIADDGSWDQAGIAIATKQFTAQENELFAQWLYDAFSLHATPMLGQDYPYVRITAVSVQLTRDLCLPHLPLSLVYKFGPTDYQTRLVGKAAVMCRGCGENFMEYLSNHRIYCSRVCAAKDPNNSGYATRTTFRACERCDTEFLVYTKRQTRCVPCRTLRIEPVPCAICSTPVWKIGSETCSRSCNTLLGRSRRQPQPVPFATKYVPPVQLTLF
jgi:hypothetical protein